MMSFDKFNSQDFEANPDGIADIEEDIREGFSKKARDAAAKAENGRRTVKPRDEPGEIVKAYLFTWDLENGDGSKKVRCYYQYQFLPRRIVSSVLIRLYQ